MKFETEFEMEERSQRITRQQQAVFGLAETVAVKEVWVEADFQGERGGEWRAAYRLALYRGQPVIAEIRVFPADRYPGRKRASWRAEVLGVNSGGGATIKKSVLGHEVVLPAVGTGINARLLRKVPLGAHLKYVGRTMEGLREGMKRDLQAWGLRPTTSSPRRTGAYPDLELARLAAEYVKRTQVSRRPVADLASRKGTVPSKVRDMIHEARERGLLSAGRQGAPGGQLTPLAEGILGNRSTVKGRRKS